MILMPIYRYNTAGLQICDPEKEPGVVLQMPCNAFPYVIVLVVVVWIASCCTSFAFNKNDYSKEFGYSTRAVQEDQDSDNAASPQSLSNKKKPELHIDDSEIERADENESPM